MFSCTFKEASDHPVARLSGSLTLEHSGKIHAELLALLSRTEVMTIDLGDSVKSDVSFLQILFALLKEPGKTILFSNLPAHLLDNAARLGADALMSELSNREEKNACARSS